MAPPENHGQTEAQLDVFMDLALQRGDEHRQRLRITLCIELDSSCLGINVGLTHAEQRLPEMRLARIDVKTRFTEDWTTVRDANQRLAVGGLLPTRLLQQPFEAADPLFTIAYCKVPPVAKQSMHKDVAGIVCAEHECVETIQDVRSVLEIGDDRRRRVLSLRVRDQRRASLGFHADIGSDADRQERR